MANILKISVQRYNSHKRKARKILIKIGTIISEILK